MESILYKLIQKVNRDIAIAENFYDGRFKTKIVKDKKKNSYLKLRKQKFNIHNDI